MESLISNQLCISRAASALSCDHALGHRELTGRHPKSLPCHIQERFARRCRRLTEILRIEVGRRRLTSRRGALVRRNRGVALNQLYASKCHAQFFCDELGLRSEHTLSKITLSRVSLHGSVG